VRAQFASRRRLRALQGLSSHGLIRSSGWLLFGSALARAATLGASVVVARIVAPAEFGQLTLMQTSVLLLGGLAGLGLSLAITRQVAEARTSDPNLAGRYLGSALALTVLGAAVVTGILLAGQTLFAGLLLGDRDLTALITAGAGAVAFTALNAAIQAALLGLESFRRVSASQWLQGVGTALGLIVGAAVNGVTGSLVGLTLGQAVSAAVSFALLRRATMAAGVPLSYRLERDKLRRLWRIGLPTFAAFLAVASSLLAGQVILSHQADGYEEVGLFAISYRWHLAILFVPAAMVPALVPVITRLNARARHELPSLFRDSLQATLLLLAMPALVIAVASPLLLGLSGEFYGDHPLPLILLAVAAVPAGLNNVLSSTSVGLGAMRAWLVSDVVLAAVLVGTAAVLVGGLGATGLALAYLAGYTATDLALAGPLAKRLRAARRQSPAGHAEL
jgi:O-antigen/teichoic acid export membrane protein